MISYLADILADPSVDSVHYRHFVHTADMLDLANCKHCIVHQSMFLHHSGSRIWFQHDIYRKRHNLRDDGRIHLVGIECWIRAVLVDCLELHSVVVVLLVLVAPGILVLVVQVVAHSVGHNHSR